MSYFLYAYSYFRKPSNLTNIHRLMEEIRRSPVEVGSLPHYLQGFIHPNGGCLGFLNHQLEASHRLRTRPLTKPDGAQAVSWLVQHLRGLGGKQLRDEIL